MLKRTSIVCIVAAVAIALPLLGIALSNDANTCSLKCGKAVSLETVSDQDKDCVHKCGKGDCEESCAHKHGKGGCEESCLDKQGRHAYCKKKAEALKAKEIATLKSVVSEMRFRESTQLVLEGKYVCGKCTIKKFERCKPLFETSDGDIYPLIVNHMVRKMKRTESEDGFRITSKVKRVDGVKHLEVKRFEKL